MPSRARRCVSQALSGPLASNASRNSIRWLLVSESLCWRGSCDHTKVRGWRGMIEALHRVDWSLTISLGSWLNPHSKSTALSAWSIRLYTHRHVWERGAHRMSSPIRREYQQRNQSSVSSGLRDSQTVLLPCRLDSLAKGSVKSPLNLLPNSVRAEVIRIQMRWRWKIEREPCLTNSVHCFFFVFYCAWFLAPTAHDLYPQLCKVK